MPSVLKSDLVGVWKLATWTIHRDDRAEPTLPFGAHPVGLLIYSPDGWMSAAISRADRVPMVQGLALRKQDNQRLADAYCSYFHYAGSYRLEGDRIFHIVTQSLNPDFVGTVQERHVQLDGQRLLLTGKDELMRTHRLAWQVAEETTTDA